MRSTEISCEIHRRIVEGNRERLRPTCDKVLLVIEERRYLLCFRSSDTDKNQNHLPGQVRGFICTWAEQLPRLYYGRISGRIWAEQLPRLYYGRISGRIIVDEKALTETLTTVPQGAPVAVLAVRSAHQHADKNSGAAAVAVMTVVIFLGSAVRFAIKRFRVPLPYTVVMLCFGMVPLTTLQGLNYRELGSAHYPSTIVLRLVNYAARHKFDVFCVLARARKTRQIRRAAYVVLSVT
eukprot:g12311.t1